MKRLIIFWCCVPIFLVAQKKPLWLTDAVKSNAYYIGVAIVSKKNYPSEYQKKALDIALSFLSSEIKIEVESHVRNISRDYNGEIDLEFLSETKTLTTEEIKGYEIEDKWENRNEYAIYCRLSKDKYLESKRSIFSSDLKQMFTLKEDYDEFVRNRNLMNAIDIAVRLQSKSQKLLSNKSWHPYMTRIELSDLSEYQVLLHKLIENIKVDIQSTDVIPFTWFNGENVKILVKDINNTPWHNWIGVLYKNTQDLYRFEEQSKESVSFPTPVFVSSLDVVKFTLRLQRKVGKLYKDIKILDFEIPVTSSVSLGEIKGKNIHKSLKWEFKEIIEQIISVNHQDHKNKKGTVDVFVEFDKNYYSSGWVSGVLRFRFKNASVKDKKLGVGHIEITCGGKTIIDATKNGLYDLRKAVINDKINWK